VVVSGISKEEAFAGRRWEAGANEKGRISMAKKVWIFCGSDEPEKAFPPFMLGSGALALDMEVNLFFTMSGLNIVRKGGAEKIVLPGAAKTLPEFIKILQEGGAKMIACSAAFPIANCGEEDLIDGVECGGVATFVAGAEEADVVLTF
jgi:predicted peroxiredoxin